MYLWKVDSLVEDFKSGKVSQKEEFKYMLLFTIVMTVAMDQWLYIGSSYNHYDTISTISMLGISIFGLHYCFKINSIGDNRDFIVRVMCIGIPAMIRVSVVMSPACIGGAIFEATFLSPASLVDRTAETTPFKVALLSIFTAAYYWYLAGKIRALASSNA